MCIFFGTKSNKIHKIRFEISLARLHSIKFCPPFAHCHLVSLNMLFVSPGLCCCLLETELSRAHFCSDSCINHRLRLLGRQSVFSQHRLQVFVYPAVCRTPFKPWCAYLPACCKTTYTIPGIPPKASFGTPFPSPHLPLFLLTRTPPPLFPKNQTIVPPSWLTLHHLFL